MSQLDEIRARDAELHGELSKYNAVAIHDRRFLLSLVAEFQKDAERMRPHLRHSIDCEYERDKFVRRVSCEMANGYFSNQQGPTPCACGLDAAIDAALKQGGGS